VTFLKEQSEGWVEKFGMAIFPDESLSLEFSKEVDTSTSFDERDNQLAKLGGLLPRTTIGLGDNFLVYPFTVFFLVPEIVTNNCEDQSAPIPSEPGFGRRLIQLSVILAPTVSVQ
jgi:hypothetical protein